MFWRTITCYPGAPMAECIVLCVGYLSYVLGQNQNRVSLGCNYGGVYCLMFGIFVLCMGYLSYVWDISLMSGILVLCLE